jgi:SAM-dependent methyltransferase
VLSAGYKTEELNLLSGGESSFGCGNPLAFSAVEKGDVVLDLGAGAGLDLLVAAEKVGPTGHVIGVDMTDAMIEAARANVARAGHANVEVRKGIIEALPVESATVDHVISNCVINLSPEKEKVFAEIARVLRPGGRIRISDIVAEELPEWVKTDPDLYGACIGGAISEEAYVAGLRAAGLVEVEVVDRLRYDADQVEDVVGLASPCCGGPDPRLVSLAGKIWSATFSGRKA